MLSVVTTKTAAEVAADLGVEQRLLLTSNFGWATGAGDSGRVRLTSLDDQTAEQLAELFSCDPKVLRETVVRRGYMLWHKA